MENKNVRNHFNIYRWRLTCFIILSACAFLLNYNLVFADLNLNNITIYPDKTSNGDVALIKITAVKNACSASIIFQDKKTSLEFDTPAMNTSD